jgi:hypothetical protein
MQNRAAVQLSLRWGDVILRTTRLCPPRAFVVGPRGDWSLPEQAIGGTSLELSTHTLAPGTHTSVALGTLAIDVDVDRGDDHELPRAAIAWAPLGHQALSATLHAMILAILAMLPGRSAPSAEDARERMAQLMAVGSAGDRGDGGGNRGEDRGGGGGGGVPLWETEQTQGRAEVVAPHPPSPGAAKRNERRADAPTRLPASTAARELAPHASHEAALAEASAFGAIGLLRDAEQGGGASTSWGRQANGTGAGAVYGDGIGDVSGADGLGIGGLGEEGGGRGEGIAIGDVGGLGHGAGTVGGMGGMFGRLGGNHRPRAPICRCDEVEVNGRLPPETILRIVQENEGRFRLCYERGHDKNAGLQGRVTTLFLIGRDGTVVASKLVEEESDMPDASVAQCVVRTFETIAFPAPAGGTVNVEYPFVFTPE